MSLTPGWWFISIPGHGIAYDGGGAVSALWGESRHWVANKFYFCLHTPA